MTDTTLQIINERMRAVDTLLDFVHDDIPHAYQPELIETLDDIRNYLEEQLEELE